MVANSEPDYSLDCLGKYRPECLSLLKLMLVKEPTLRPSAKDCLNHSWFGEKAADSVGPVSQNILQGFKSYTLTFSLEHELLSRGIQYPAVSKLVEDL